MSSPDDIHVTLAPNQNSSAPENERNQTGVPGPIRPNRRISRPKLTIPILRVSTPPNQTPRSPMHTPRITIPITPAGIAPIGQVPHPLGMLQLYPTKAGEFMFKRFEGFKDFTMNTAKSGLSVGEKSAFWIYGKVTAWSRKWFTHIFLFLVVLAYSLLGAIIFVTIEGMHEEKERANVVVERQNLVEKLQATFQDHQYYNNTERLYSDAIQEIKLFEEQLFEHYKHGFTNKETKVWSFWNAVFYCGTIYTTIGLAGTAGRVTRPSYLRSLCRVERSCNEMSEPQEVVVPTTPEQVLAAGGVSRRRRRVSGSETRRRSPSGPRKRPPTPEPSKDIPLVDDESPIAQSLEQVVKPARRKTSKDKNSSKHRSLSSPGDVALRKPETDVPKDSREDVKSTETLQNTKNNFEKDESSLKTDIETKTEQNIDTYIERKENIENNKVEDVFKIIDTKEIKEVDKKSETKVVKAKKITEPIWRPFVKECRTQWGIVKQQYTVEYRKTILLRNRCVAWLIILIIYCGIGGIIFRFTEGAFESFYKCGVKRVKRTLIDDLWQGNHYLPEDEWRSQARRKLMEFEEQLHTAHEAGVKSYSGQRAWSFLNAVVYCLTVVTTIGYGHISPSTTTGRGITIVYAIFGIPMFLILLADFGKLFTRGIKFIWAFVRRVYYTGSCKKVRRTVPVQEVMKGVQLVYDFATFRRPSQMDVAAAANANNLSDEDREAQEPLQQPNPVQISVDGLEPGTPVPSVFEVDDEFNLPISVAIVILVIYIFCGATIYYIWEDWGFFESFYFVFISMSTIGFGDYVPAHPMYMMASIVYLVFGLALTSMCINVVQEKLSDSFRHASAKIGATIGLQVSDEDGTITPMAPLTAELAEVQTPRITKSSSDIPQGNTLTPPAPQSLSM